jgi:D-xylose transport system substrate-binding protein
MSVYKPIKDLAPKAAELAVALAKKQKPATTATVNNGTIEVPSVLLKIISVDKSNILETVIKDKFKTYDEVYVNIPAAQRPPKP